MGMAIMGNYPHGDKYWSENGVTDPTREDYIFHVEFNYFHNIGNGILTDFGAVYIGIGQYALLLMTKNPINNLTIEQAA